MKQKIERERAQCDCGNDEFHVILDESFIESLECTKCKERIEFN